MSLNTNYEYKFKDETSSFITGFNYDSKSQALKVFFKNNQSYKYFDVPHDIPDQFLLAESKGKFLHSTLKDKFRGEKGETNDSLDKNKLAPS